MPSVKDKPQVGRQTHLPLSRAFQISFKSLKIRFGRSIITAGGIFLGIAFLSTVFTQSLMNWPLPEKVDAGYVRISGTVEGPGDYDVWRPVPPDKAAEAGIPLAVIDRSLDGDGMVNLREVVQGRLDYDHAKLSRETTKKNYAALQKVGKKLYTGDKADKDISIKDAVKAGVPEGVAKRLAGDGKSFKGSALQEALDAYPGRIKIWERKTENLSAFAAVDPRSSQFKQFADDYAISLADVFKEAKTNIDPSNSQVDTDWTQIMIVNKNGRKESWNFTDSKVDPAKIALGNGDYVYAPDKNVRYRTIWLVVMSLLVCTVGITNSMLMSVTERFKEIGTMKCLGAMDRFVVTLFILESGMMGIVASIMGWAVGFGIMVLMAGSSKGWEIVGTIEGMSVLWTFLGSIVIGMVLTMIATIAPALRAANMPAAMALRTEI